MLRADYYLSPNLLLGPSLVAGQVGSAATFHSEARYAAESEAASNATLYWSQQTSSIDAARTVALSQKYPWMPTGVIEAASIAGIEPDSATAEWLADRSAAQPSTPFNFLAPIGDLVGNAMALLRGNIRLATTAFDAAWEEGLARPLRTASYIGKGYDLASAYGEAGQSTGVRAIGQFFGGGGDLTLADRLEAVIRNVTPLPSKEGQGVNLGSGWFPGATLATADSPEVLALAQLLQQNGLTQEQAVTAAQEKLQAQYGAPIAQIAKQQAEKATIYDRAGNAIGVSPGRLLAVALGQTSDTLGLKVISGLGDFAAQIFLDPSNYLLAGASKARLASRMITTGERVVAPWATHIDDLVASGLYRNRIVPALTKMDNMIDIENALKINVEHGTDEIGSIRKLYRDLVDAKTNDATHEVLLPHLGTTITHVPGSQSVLSTIGHRMGVTIPTLGSQLSGSRLGSRIIAGRTGDASQLAEVGRAFGMKAAVRHRLDGTWLGRMTSQMGSRILSTSDLDAGYASFNRMLSSLGLSAERQNDYLYRFAGIANGDRSSVLNLVSESLKEWGKGRVEELVAKGWSRSEAKQFINGFTRMYKNDEELVKFFTNKLGDPQWFPGGHFDVIGTQGEVIRIKAKPTVHTVAEMLQSAIPLPDPRGIRRLNSYLSNLPVAKLTSKFEKVADKTGVKHVTGVIEPRMSTAMADAYMQRFWKPMVLARFAWPVKVLGEEAMRIAAVGKASMFSHPLQWLGLATGQIMPRTLAHELPTPKQILKALGKEGEDLTTVFGEELQDFYSTLAAQAGGWISADGRQLGVSFIKIARDDPKFIGAVVDQMRRIRANDSITRRLWEDGIDETATWLYSGEGRVLLKRLREVGIKGEPQTYAEVHEYLQSLEARIHMLAGGGYIWWDDVALRWKDHYDQFLPDDMAPPPPRGYNPNDPPLPGFRQPPRGPQPEPGLGPAPDATPKIPEGPLDTQLSLLDVPHRDPELRLHENVMDAAEAAAVREAGTDVGVYGPDIPIERRFGAYQAYTPNQLREVLLTELAGEPEPFAFDTLPQVSATIDLVFDEIFRRATEGRTLTEIYGDDATSLIGRVRNPARADAVFESMGFSPEDAQRLGNIHADWQRARSLNRYLRSRQVAESSQLGVLVGGVDPDSSLHLAAYAELLDAVADIPAGAHLTEEEFLQYLRDVVDELDVPFGVTNRAFIDDLMDAEVAYSREATTPLPRELSWDDISPDAALHHLPGEHRYGYIDRMDEAGIGLAARVNHGLIYLRPSALGMTDAAKVRVAMPASLPTIPLSRVFAELGLDPVVDASDHYDMIGAAIVNQLDDPRLEATGVRFVNDLVEHGVDPSLASLYDDFTSGWFASPDVLRDLMPLPFTDMVSDRTIDLLTSLVDGMSPAGSVVDGDRLYEAVVDALDQPYDLAYGQRLREIAAQLRREIIDTNKDALEHLPSVYRHDSAFLDEAIVGRNSYVSTQKVVRGLYQFGAYYRAAEEGAAEAIPWTESLVEGVAELLANRGSLPTDRLRDFDAQVIDEMYNLADTLGVDIADIADGIDEAMNRIGRMTADTATRLQMEDIHRHLNAGRWNSPFGEAQLAPATIDEIEHADRFYGSLDIPIEERQAAWAEIPDDEAVIVYAAIPDEQASKAVTSGIDGVVRVTALRDVAESYPGVAPGEDLPLLARLNAEADISTGLPPNVGGTLLTYEDGIVVKYEHFGKDPTSRAVAVRWGGDEAPRVLQMGQPLREAAPVGQLRDALDRLVTELEVNGQPVHELLDATPALVLRETLDTLISSNSDTTMRGWVETAAAQYSRITGMEPTQVQALMWEALARAAGDAGFHGIRIPYSVITGGGGLGGKGTRGVISWTSRGLPHLIKEPLMTDGFTTPIAIRIRKGDVVDMVGTGNGAVMPGFGAAIDIGKVDPAQMRTVRGTVIDRSGQPIRNVRATTKNMRRAQTSAMEGLRSIGVGFPEAKRAIETLEDTLRANGYRVEYLADDGMTTMLIHTGDGSPPVSINFIQDEVTHQWEISRYSHPDITDGLREALGHATLEDLEDTTWAQYFIDDYLPPPANPTKAYSMFKVHHEPAGATRLQSVEGGFEAAELRARIGDMPPINGRGGGAGGAGGAATPPTPPPSEEIPRIFIKTGEADDVLKEMMAKGKVSLDPETEIRLGRGDQSIDDVLRKRLEGLRDEGRLPDYVPMRNPNSTVPQGAWDRIVSKMMYALMSAPTNLLSRNPTWKQYYVEKTMQLLPFLTPELRTRTLERLTKDVKKGGMGLSDVNLRTFAGRIYDDAMNVTPSGQIKSMATVDELASAYALSQTKDLLYDLSKRSNASDILRNIFPFAEAWREIITVWAKIMWEHPEVLRRLQQGVEGARDTGFFYNNENGDEVFAYPGLDLVGNWMMGNKQGVDVQFEGRTAGLNIALGGWLPGFGPAVQVPVGLVAPKMPVGWDWVSELVAPFGVEQLDFQPGSLMNLAMPTWYKRGLAAVGVGGEDYQRRYYNTVIDVVRARMAEDPTIKDDPTRASIVIDEAASDARQLGIISTLAAFILPTPPTMTFSVKDKDGENWQYQTLAAEYRRLYERNGSDRVKTYGDFVNRFGLDPTIFTTSKSVRTVPRSITASGERWQRANQDLFDKYPTTAAYGLPDLEWEEFDYDAYLKQLQEDARQGVTPEVWMARRNQLLGGIAYEHARDKLNGRSDATATAWLAEVRKQIMQEYPGFGLSEIPGVPGRATREQKITELLTWQDDPRLANSNAGKGLAVYLEMRAKAQQRSLEMGFRPTGFATAQSMRPVREWLRQGAAQIVARYPDFRQLWFDVFARELEEDPGEPLTFNGMTFSEV